MTATGTTAPGGSEGETIIGATSCDAMVDGLEFNTDVDLDFAGSAFSLRIMTGDGRVYEFRAPEQPGGLPGFALRRMPVAMFMPRVERISPRRFRLRLSPEQEAVAAYRLLRGERRPHAAQG